MYRNFIRLMMLATSGLAIVPAWADSAQNTPQWRPVYHFTPQIHWMNDPNGLLYMNGQFDLFYQYNPIGDVALNQSWGHAVSRDLLSWRDLPLAIPFEADRQGKPTAFIFSGSAVRDVGNTSGFGNGWCVPLVAIYTDNYTADQVLPNGRVIKNGMESQSIAYSLDRGITWTKYAGNPVIPAPPPPYADQFNAFRDPKVFWYAPQKKWVMVAVLSNLKKAVLYSSPDLKNWSYLSEFGPGNAQLGAWECPDLFPLRVDDVGPQKWVLMVGINPGGYTAGSADQYFIGQFDGTRFVADKTSLYDINPVKDAVPVINLAAIQRYTDAGWQGSGAFAGAGPVLGSHDGSTATGFIDTFLGADSATGTLTSPVFRITHPFIEFQIGGGYHPFFPDTWHKPEDTETAINLIVDGQVVASATGNGQGAVAWRSWNVTALIGRQAQIEVVDANNGATGWGHLIVGNLVFADEEKRDANWVDYGPDFYAAVTWNGLPDAARLGIGWMSNWNYAEKTPTVPWRGQNSIPRQFGLRTFGTEVRLVQKPIDTLPIAYGRVFQARPATLISGVSTQVLGNSMGDALDLWLDFVPRDAGQFGVILRGDDTGHGTRIGYDTKTSTLFIDREHSGIDNFADNFRGVYTAPLAVDRDGHVRMRVLLDRSSVEVFGGQGQSVLSALIFPNGGSSKLATFATGGSVLLAHAWVAPISNIH